MRSAVLGVRCAVCLLWFPLRAEGCGRGCPFFWRSVLPRLAGLLPAARSSISAIAAWDFCSPKCSWSLLLSSVTSTNTSTNTSTKALWGALPPSRSWWFPVVSWIDGGLEKGPELLSLSLSFRFPLRGEGCGRVCPYFIVFVSMALHLLFCVWKLCDSSLMLEFRHFFNFLSRRLLKRQSCFQGSRLTIEAIFLLGSFSVSSWTLLFLWFGFTEKKLIWRVLSPGTGHRVRLIVSPLFPVRRSLKRAPPSLVAPSPLSSCSPWFCRSPCTPWSSVSSLICNWSHRHSRWIVDCTLLLLVIAQLLFVNGSRYCDVEWVEFGCCVSNFALRFVCRGISKRWCVYFVKVFHIAPSPWSSCSPRRLLTVDWRIPDWLLPSLTYFRCQSCLRDSLRRRYFFLFSLVFLESLLSILCLVILLFVKELSRVGSLLQASVLTTLFLEAVLF